MAMAAKSERLLNVVVMLMRGGWVTRRVLRRTVPDYRAAPTEDSFQRMFERDKAELRDLGIPVEIGPDGAQGDEVGYRVRRTDYAFPDLVLDADDLSIIAMAAKAWSDAALAQEARIATAKLGALASAGAPQAMPEWDVRLPEAGEWFSTVYGAIRDRQVLTFGYRKADASKAAQRDVEPWALISRNSAWYVVGRDLDRGEPRAFRTSRIQGVVATKGETHAYVRPTRSDMDALVGPIARASAQGMATVALASGAGVALRRRAVAIAPDAGPGGSDLITLEVADERGLAMEIGGLGGAACALEPPSLVSAVVDGLTAIVGAHQPAAPSARQPEVRP